jgi:cell division protein FtsB
LPRRKLPIGRWVGIVFLLFTLYAWTFGPYGVVRQRRTAIELDDLRRRNDSLRIRLHELADSLHLLRTDSATIASQARNQGLVLPGEVSVRFVDTTR